MILAILEYLEQKTGKAPEIDSDKILEKTSLEEILKLAGLVLSVLMTSLD